ncbi:MAG: DUF4358 domain-containing protein [Oscillibacter sp.]|nr:DUF4358 domain-containing protein [Oscillibacter sp.]
MKKLTALLLAMSLCLALSACGAKETAPEAPEASAASTEAPDVTVELPEVDPDVDVPAASTEGPEEIEMPTVPAEPGSEGPSEPETPSVEVEEPAAPEMPAVSSGVDLNGFYTSVCTTYGENFPANMNLCESVEMLDAFYPGLSGLETKQLMIYQPMMGAVVCEIALAEAANEADVETIKGIFQSRIDSQVDGGAWYPESIEGWKNNSRIVANGNTIMMIAYSECDAVVEAFNALF